MTKIYLTAASRIAYLRAVRKLLFTLVCCAALGAAEPKVEIGAINGAAFRIDVPDAWNGGLVVYCHGYSPIMVTYKNQKLPAEQQVFLDQGYALVQSGYAAAGWALQEASVDTESVRRYFIAKYGQPKETFITGHSMGSLLTVMLVENYPTVYDAALPLCGPLAASNWFLGRGAFDGIVLFNYYFPGLLPDPTKIPKDFVNSRDLAARLEKALDAAPEKAAALRHQNDLKSNRDLAGTLGFLVYLIKELDQRAGGNPFDTRNTIYHGTLDDNVTNDVIPRYTADPKAVAYLRGYYIPTGRIQNPVLAIHTSYDPLVPLWIPNTYQSTVEDAGTANLFVQQYVKHDGHCAIQADEIARGFAELREWKSTGTRPQGGELKK
jgi:pimeloyl-ACP methyl ester carboxylesterase